MVKQGQYLTSFIRVQKWESAFLSLNLVNNIMGVSPCPWNTRQLYKSKNKGVVMEDIKKLAHGQCGSDGNEFRRLKRIEIKASNQEYVELRELAHRSGYTNLAQYMREIGLSGKEIHSKTKRMEAIRFCQFELNKIDNNLNDFSRQLNLKPNEPFTEEALLVLMQIKELAENTYQSAKGAK